MGRRFVIYGAGAVGGVIGAGLALSGHPVALIARGPHLQAIRARGLELRTERGSERVQAPATDDPAELDLQPDDIVVLATKTQDSVPALDRLAAVAPEGLAIVCAQNGVENERLAQRRFSEVYAMNVMLPGTHLEPGVVIGSGTPDLGILDVGRYPSGTDATAQAVAEALEGSRFRSRADPAIMGHKYAKLLVNTANAVEAACGRVSRHGGLAQRAREEAEAVFAAAGIEVAPSEEWQARRGDFAHVDVDGIPRQGGSSWQSLARNAGSIEADYLNGEVVLLGRLHGVATPVNQALQQVANRMARDRVPPGSFAADEIEALITELSRRPG